MDSASNCVAAVTRELGVHLAEHQATFPQPHEFGSAESTMLLALYGLTTTAVTAAAAAAACSEAQLV